MASLRCVATFRRHRLRLSVRRCSWRQRHGIDKTNKTREPPSRESRRRTATSRLHHLTLTNFQMDVLPVRRGGLRKDPGFRASQRCTVTSLRLHLMRFVQLFQWCLTSKARSARTRSVLGLRASLRCIVTFRRRHWRLSVLPSNLWICALTAWNGEPERGLGSRANLQCAVTFHHRRSRHCEQRLSQSLRRRMRSRQRGSGPDSMASLRRTATSSHHHPNMSRRASISEIST